jgi:ATP-dependent RNA helicase RhlE
MNFDELKLNKQLLSAIADLGYKKPTPIQEQIIPKILDGHDVLGIAPTGTGKTAAFVLPILRKLNYAQGDHPRALIFVPTRELAVQVYENAVKYAVNTDIRCCRLIGGMGMQAQLKEVQKGVDLIVATPGRFMDIYSRGEIHLKKVQTLVLDEADKMMDMGFLPQLNSILEIIPNKRQNLLFSATFHPKVEELTEEFLDFPVKVEVNVDMMVIDLVDQYLYRVPNAKTKLNLLVHLLRIHEEYSRVLIFARTRETAENIHKYLNRMEIGEWKAIHANKGQNTRLNAYEEFSEGKIRGIVATDVAARGIDVSEVSHVINFDAPVMYTDYVHRVGRTGRAEKEGVAITFASEVEHYHIRKIEELIGQEIKLLKIPKEVELLDTSYDEKQAFAREIDRQKRKEDPTYQGAFHDRKKAALKNPNKANHKTIQAYKFITEEGDNHKNKGKGKGKSKAKVPKPKRKGKKR